MKKFTDRHKELIDEAKQELNRHLSHKLIRIANDNNITCYKQGKVFKLGFAEDVNHILPSDLFKLADLLKQATCQHNITPISPRSGSPCICSKCGFEHTGKYIHN